MEVRYGFVALLADGDFPPCVCAGQRHLVEMGALPVEVMAHEDNFPLPAGTVRQAVADVVSPHRPTACRALAVVLSHPELAAEAVAAAYQAAQGDARLTYAKVLAGSEAAAPADAASSRVADQPQDAASAVRGAAAADLLAALEAAEWDEKICQGRMAEYAHLPTPVDALVLALGWLRAKAAVPAILRKLHQLDAASPLSHHFAAAQALDRLADPAAAEAIARLMQKPRMAGHDMPAVEPRHDKPFEKRRREGAPREMTLARALYRCGDWQNLGQQTLTRYLHDLRSVLSRHAAMVLRSYGPGKPFRPAHG